MSKTLFYEIAASANGNRIPSLCKTLEITPSTPTERHLIGVGEGGDLEEFTYPSSILSFDDIIKYLDDRDRGYKWAARNSPITYYGPNTLVSDPFHGTVVAVTRYGDVRVSGDGFDTFSEASVGNAGSRAYGFYDSNRHRIFIPSDSSTSPDVWSDDGGYTWSQGMGVTSRLVQQSGAKYNATHDTYIISANGDVWVSEDGGATFAITQTGDTWTRSAVGVSPSGLTVHLRWLSGTNQLSCRISTDGGLTWGASKNLYAGTGYRPGAIIWASKSSKFIVSCNNYILTSVDGITWTAYTTHLGDWNVLLEDPNTKHMWRFNNAAPSAVRTAFSSDGGITWRHFAGGAISGGSDSSVTIPIIYDCVYDYKSRRFIRLCNNDSSLGSVIEISPP